MSGMVVYTILYIERILREGMPLVIEKVMRVVTKETGSLICQMRIRIIRMSGLKWNRNR